jgi:hypothetical protein
MFAQGMPPSMEQPELSQNVGAARNQADTQPSGNPRSRPGFPASSSDPSSSDQSRISDEDLRVMREKFPMLNDFTEQFLRSRTLDELLRLESTSLRIRDAERAKESEERLAQNKAALPTKFYEVKAGRDNRWSEIHPARFLPGMACTATKQFQLARDVIGLSSPPALACYDMTSVGMGGFVTPKGWMEIGNMGSTKLKVSLFNINNVSKSTTRNSSEYEESEAMKSIDEFELALRTMRCAAHFSVPWNYSIVALENYLLNRKFCREELKNDPNPARTLVQFCDFVLSENANHWRDGSTFLTTGDLTSYWDNFIGARPHLKGQATQSASQPIKTKAKQSASSQQAKKKFPPSPDICHKWNVGKCGNNTGACFSFNGTALKHVCNWRDPSAPNSPPCGQAHTRRGNH